MTRQMKCIVLAVLAALAQPVLAQSVSRTDTQTYEDNLGAWVIGQPKTSTNVNTGLVESETVYDATTALPIRTYKFGKLQQTYTYNANGTLATASDARDTPTFNTTVTFSSWKRGLPQRIDFSTGEYKTLSVDEYGLIKWVEDENRYRTCYTFDPMGRLAGITYPSESVLQTCNTSKWGGLIRTFQQTNVVEYGLSAGHWREFVQTGRGQKSVYYDAMWRPVLTRTNDMDDVNNTLSQVVTRYDHDGKAVFQSYPTRATISDFKQTLPGIRTTYDALGRPTRAEQEAEADVGGVLASTTEYLTDFTTRTTNPRGKSTTTTYRTYDQPSTDWPLSINAAGIAITDITRDTFGKPTVLKRSDVAGTLSASRTYLYNAAQELCRTLDPETGYTFYGYDEASNVKWSAAGINTTATDCITSEAAVAHRRVDRTYDERNRIKTLAFVDGRGNTTYTYTPDGLQSLLTVENGGGANVSTTYSYNRRRLMTKEQMDWGSIAWAVTYDYNSNGHLLSQGYPGNLLVDYAPNALGQATKAGTYATNVSYYPNGAIAGFLYGNGITHTLTQNERQLPLRSTDAFGQSTYYLDDTYDYDQNGNVLAISDGTSGNRGDRDMTYDSLDRLTSVKSLMYSSTSTPGTMFFSYDALDNITSVGAWNRSQRYCYDTATNRLTFIRTPASSVCPNGGAATTALSYDVQGNVSSKNNNVYEFDFGNRLRSATDGTTSTTYVYDALGRRVRDVTGSSRYSLYTQAGQVAYTTDARAAKTSNYIYLAGSLVAIRSAPTGTTNYTVEYQHTDALGTPVVVTNANRGMQRSEYEPYGSVINRPKTDGIGFTGHVEDGATGLTYMQQRYYDAAIGVFLSVDPVDALEDPLTQFNAYRYAMSNPFAYVDPDGRQSVSQDSSEECKSDCPDPDQRTNREKGKDRESKRLDQQGWSISVTDWVAAHPVPQSVADPVLGAGSGVMSGVSAGLIDSEYFGIDLGYADQESLGFKAGNVAGKINGVMVSGLIAARGLATLSNFSRFRFLNQNPYLRFGLGKPSGKGFIPKVPMMRIGPNPWNVTSPTKIWWTHWRL